MIRADEQVSTQKEPKKRQPTATGQEKDPQKELEALSKIFGGMAEHAGEKNAKDMKEAGAFFEALGGLMGGQVTKEQKEAKKQAKEKQKADNVKADKEFEDMSKELDMFIK